MNDDLALLQRYADHGDDEAFSTLVRRNLNLIWGAARRITVIRHPDHELDVRGDPEGRFDSRLGPRD